MLVGLIVSSNWLPLDFQFTFFLYLSKNHADFIMEEEQNNNQENNNQEEEEEKAPAIGIDLGTTYSCVAVWQYGMVEIVANELGHHTTPSFVAFGTPKGRLIGDAAKDMTADKNLPEENVKNIIFNSKRLIGRKFNEESVQQDIRHFTFPVVNERGNPKIQVIVFQILIRAKLSLVFSKGRSE